MVTAYEDKNGFIYTEFTNSRGQTSKGWLRKQDLITPEEWEQKKAANAKPTETDIRGQLAEASSYLQNNQVEDALRIYNFLTGLNVPDAMYEAANLALQGKNPSLACDDAIALLKKSADVGHLPAKRTLGILYLFAENKAVLQINNYTQCGFDKNFVKGRSYLIEAANGGDTTARQLLDELNISEQGNPPQ
jgi:serine/threonine-protein kinase